MKAGDANAFNLLKIVQSQDEQYAKAGELIRALLNDFRKLHFKCT